MEGIRQGDDFKFSGFRLFKKAYLSRMEFDKEMILDSWHLDCLKKKQKQQKTKKHLSILEGVRQGYDFRHLGFRLFENKIKYEKKTYLSWKEFDKIFYSTALDCLKNYPFIPRL